MSFACSELHVATSDGRNFRLLDPVTFVASTGEIITIPVGATSDGASTPEAVWSIIPPFGRYWMAAFLHDYLYRRTGRPKAECDTLLNDAMASLGVPELERLTIYEAVKNFGAHAFTQDRSQ